MSARDNRNGSHMRTSNPIPLRFLHTVSANFTLPIQQKPLATSLLPFSLKKATVKLPRIESERPTLR